MKILVISDIHSNLSALQAVLEDAGDTDAVWCLGDLVGYGPDPNECVDLIRSLANITCLIGNHDAASLGQIGVESFNRDASISALWTQEHLSKENREYLQNLPDKKRIPEFDVTLTHGSPRNPVWEYLLDIYTAADNFNYFDTRYCFVGHTHLPLVYQILDTNKEVKLTQFLGEERIILPYRSILNPGSVGQPRDHDPRAAYALFYPDDNLWEAHRTCYDIKSVQERIMRSGLPARHAERLEEGW